MTKLRLHVEGAHGAVSFRAFVDVLNRTRLLLSELDGAISEEPKGVVNWTITDLGVASADAVIEASPPKPGFEQVPALVGSNFVNGLGVVEQGEEIPPYFSELSLKRTRAIANYVGRGGVEGFSVTDVDHPERTAHVTRQAAVSVAKLLAPKYSGEGSVIGNLGLISVRRTHVFNVYEPVTHRAVRCKFEPDRLDEVKEALKMRVLVAGLVNRNANGEPLSVENPEITVLPSDADSRPLRDLYALDRNFTGTLSSGEYVKGLRD